MASFDIGAMETYCGPKDETITVQLPPLPEYPGRRFVFDVFKEGDAVFEHKGDSKIWDVSATGRLVSVYERVVPDPIPERVERALRAAIELGRGATNEVRLDRMVRNAWQQSK